MKKHAIGISLVFFVSLFTIIDTGVHIAVMEVRPDMMATWPMVGEIISEGFNLVFAMVILVFLGFGYNKKDKASLLLNISAVLFYISMLHDLLDEFFVMTVPSVAFEVIAFPFALVFCATGIYLTQKYQNALFADNERLKLQYLEMSNKDSLTGLYNTRHFYDHVPNLIEKYIVEDRPLTLMMVDIDDFKIVNDTYGHLEGDRLIGHLGEMIRGAYEKEYLCYRYGGEEFVIVLDGVNLELCIKYANGFRESFSQVAFMAEDSSYHKTISIGLATLEAGDDAKSLLGKADKAMYEAKAKGKNMVSVVSA